MVVIRPMQIKDIEAVQEIDRLSFSAPWPAGAFRFELLENEQSLVWVAEQGGKEADLQVVGSLVIWLILDEAHIATVAVHPDYRQGGIGKFLLARGLLEAMGRETDQATLEVRSSNLAAQALYRGFGFQVVGRRARYYRDNREDALIMTVVYQQEPGGVSAYRRRLKSILRGKDGDRFRIAGEGYLSVSGGVF